ncbi:hypothetical protein HJG60_008612 [Phyllostomus discolor]|uniref:Uncharacterized protein n=1 Tax=Phyllostomus discolor TaxID=89673 RepID=A0A834DL99_9CHIR|nr:hypothetical protein HJG60_008612 [Phyllostomus discolor]
MWGQGLRGNNGAFSTVCGTSVPSAASPEQTGPLWCQFLCGVGLCRLSFPRTSPVGLGISPCASTFTGIFNQCPKALFPSAKILGCAQCLASQLPPCWVYWLPPLGRGLPAAACALRVHLLWSCVPWMPMHPVPMPSALCAVTLAQVPDYPTPTNLDEHVYLNFLVVRLPFRSIFCQFWLLFCSKLLLSLSWLCKEA